MPLSKEEHRKYILRLTRSNRKRAIEHLGGVCVRCGSVDDLETDHIENRPGKKRICDLLSGSWERLEEELAHCQLLCRKCHQKKTTREQGKVVFGERHGHRTVYRIGCRCDDCKKAQADYCREYNRHKRALS